MTCNRCMLPIKQRMVADSRIELDPQAYEACVRWSFNLPLHQSAVNPIVSAVFKG